MTRDAKYEALVSAKTPEEAVEIALEALPSGKRVVRTEALDVSAEEGPNSYRVTVVFAGFGGEMGD